MKTREMEEEIEELRSRLNVAVVATKGDFQSVEVYEISQQLDVLISQFMSLKNQQ